MKNTNMQEETINNEVTEVLVENYLGEEEEQMEKEMKEVDIKDIKDVERIPTGDAIISDLGDKYLIEPYKIERDEEGNVSHRYYSPYTLSKKWKGYQFPLYFQEIDEETEMNTTNTGKHSEECENIKEEQQ